MIYLDNAATTMIKPPCVAEAVAGALTSLGNASRGAHEGALNSNRLLYRTRGKLAKLFGCPKSEQVIFTANSTEALNIAISGTLKAGDHVITTALEHNSVLRPLYRLNRERGVALSVVSADNRGCIDCGEIEKHIQNNTRAVVCTHASNLTGNLVDIDRIGQIARAHGLLFIVDASQTAGEVPIDMAASGISLLCFTGHKSMMGPQGTGGLCINGDIEVEPLKVGGTGVQSYLETQPREYPTRLEAGTLNGHGIAGLSAAVDFIVQTGIGAIHAHAVDCSFHGVFLLLSSCDFTNGCDGRVCLFYGIEISEAEAHRALLFGAQGPVHQRRAVGARPGGDAVVLCQRVAHQRRIRLPHVQRYDGAAIPA